MLNPTPIRNLHGWIDERDIERTDDHADQAKDYHPLRQEILVLNQNSTGFDLLTPFVIALPIEADVDDEDTRSKIDVIVERRVVRGTI